MDGSSLSLIVIPIVVMACLAAWLVIVYYADSHPLWRHQQARPYTGTRPAALAARQHTGPNPHRPAGSTPAAHPRRNAAQPDSAGRQLGRFGDATLAESRVDGGQQAVT